MYMKFASFRHGPDHRWCGPITDECGACAGCLHATLTEAVCHVDEAHASPELCLTHGDDHHWCAPSLTKAAYSSKRVKCVGDSLTSGGQFLGRDDVVVYNAGLHKNDRTRLYQQLDSFGRELLAQRGRHSLPRWVYVTTVTQHFATSDGQYSNGRRSKRCQPSIPSNPRLESELSVLREGVNVNRILRVDDLDAGALHVGAYDGSDCTHYCMPGVPDVTAHRLLELVHPHNLRRRRRPSTSRSTS